MASDEFARLHKHTARATAGGVDFPIIVLDHFGDKIDHTLWRVEITLEFAFGGGKFAQKIFLNTTSDVFCLICNRVDGVYGIL